MALEKIGHYSMTTPASVYDEEALTALELAGRTAAKTNEAVQAFNALEEETTSHLQQQDGDIKTMREVEMPAKVAEEVQNHIDDGTFDRAINEYAGDLEQRVNHLIGSVPEGSSTMDAEIIDARMDSTGSVWATLGTAFRGRDKHTSNILEQIATAQLEEVVGDFAPGFYTENNGTIKDSDLIEYRMFAVEPGEVYKIYTHYGYTIYDAIAFDADNNVVKTYNTAEKAATSSLEWNYIIPEGATKLLVHNSNSVGKDKNIYKVVGWSTNVSDILAYTNNVIAPLNMAGAESGENLATNLTEAIISGDGRIVGYENTIAGKFYYVAEVDVQGGERYIIHATANYQNKQYVIKDSVGRVLEMGDPIPEGTTDTSALRSIHKEVFIPYGGVKLYVATRTTDGINSMYVKKVTEIEKTGNMWAGLKWACVGDSLTETNLRTTKNYHDFIKDKTGIDVVNMGDSGSGYKRGEDSIKAFYQKVSEVPLDCDVITIFGSGNDLGSTFTMGNETDTGTDTICGCINTTLDNLINRFLTNGKVPVIGVVTPTPWQNNTPDLEWGFTTYSNAILAICKRRGIPCLDLFRCSNLFPDNETFRSLVYSNDGGSGVHPNETGHKMIASQFYSFLQSLIGAF